MRQLTASADNAGSSGTPASTLKQLVVGSCKDLCMWVCACSLSTSRHSGCNLAIFMLSHPLHHDLRPDANNIRSLDNHVSSDLACTKVATMHGYSSTPMKNSRVALLGLDDTPIQTSPPTWSNNRRSATASSLATLPTSFTRLETNVSNNCQCDGDDNTPLGALPAVDT